MAALPVFQWANGGVAVTPQDAARKRAVAAALLAQNATPATNWGQGLSQLAGGYVGGVLNDRAGEAEAQGQSEVAKALAGLTSASPQQDLIAAASNPWATPTQEGIAETLLKGQLDQSDPLYKLKLQQAQQDVANGGSNLPGSVQEYNFYAAQTRAAGGEPVSYLEYQTQRGGANELSLTPTYLQGPNGEIVMGQANRNGQVVPSKLPDGFSVVDPSEMAASKAATVADEKNAAAARAALPGAEQAYALTTQALNNFDPKNMDASAKGVRAGEEENFGNVLGVPQQYLPAWKGSNRQNFLNIVDQLSGNAFLNIRQALKGAGQVTDFEGQKGEQAISRMRGAAEKGDKTAFEAALKDYKDAIDNGLKLLRDTATKKYAAGSPNVTGDLPAPDEINSLVDKYLN